jgi:hypothetical protein
MTKQHLTQLFMPLAMLTVGAVALCPIAIASDNRDSEQVTKLLSEAKKQANQLREDAATMEVYSRENSDWALRKEEISAMRDDINATGRTLGKLDRARATASPWQVTAIDRIKPLLMEIAANTDTLIRAVNNDPKRLNVAEYKEYIEANSDEAAHLAQLISDFVNYGNSKNRVEHLVGKLEIPKT